ncbi:Por secretion system C-terminal sorting domain-containing protein [Pedobacter sp. ok626]|uniref:T9SS type A sorting domain-containing protein n=1 Tax=Pedobacter sp. ok626 TaxID=1761882 RepID=UPI0008813D34|nr:T9SS type A sorting domain-containing protein [Pedobacter sp. ok626]SDI98589.1 Por secretion system C-terminal sorting domain-containing protein [Pedobacter sp. ok626]
MKSVFFALIFLLGVLKSALAQSIPFPLGLHRPNLSWVTDGNASGSNSDEWKAILDKIAATGATCVRLNPNPHFQGQAISVEQLKYANSKGLKVLIEIPITFPDFYPICTKKYATGSFGEKHRLREIDPVKMRTWFTSYLAKLKVAEIDIAAIEFGNELNWMDFNNDVDAYPGGRMYDYNTPWNDTQYVKIREGIQKYGECIKGMYEEIGIQFPTDRPKLISCGLVMQRQLDSWHISHNAAIVLSDMWIKLLQGTHPNQQSSTNYLNYLDGIGIHLYPSPDTPEEEVGDEIKALAGPVNAIIQNSGKMLYVTEFGYRSISPVSEEDRYLKHYRFIQAASQLSSYQWGGFYLYTFDHPSSAENDWVIYKKGELLKTAKIFEDFSYLMLPVQLNAFRGAAKGKSITINWSTVSETNHERFELFRSSDAKEFSKIATRTGAGSSNQQRYYTYEDIKPLPGTNYYRLKQIDFDGKYSNSEVIAVHTKLGSSSLFVTVSEERPIVNILFMGNAKGTIYLYDIFGKKLAEQQVVLYEGSNQIALPIQLVQGIYVVRVSAGTETLVKKFKV